jgi:ketosteroid isomerase-like protein
MSISNREIVERFLHAERRRRPLTMMRLTTRDVILRLPDSGSALGPAEHRGRRRAVRAMARIMWLTRWSLRITPREITEQDNAVRVDALATAHRGDKRLRQPLAMVFRLRGGRICAVEETTPELTCWHEFWD